MLSKKEITKLKKELEQKDSKKEKSITLSRNLTKQSKQVIYDIHRGNTTTVPKKLAAIRKQFPKKVLECFSPSYQEYSEAYLFYHYVTTKKVASYSKLAFGAENYLAALADLTGELSRRAVILATKKQSSQVKHIKDTIESIFGAFLQFNLRNGELRRKYDAIKWNLAKVESLLYDLKIKNI